MIWAKMIRRSPAGDTNKQQTFEPNWKCCFAADAVLDSFHDLLFWLSCNKSVNIEGIKGVNTFWAACTEKHGGFQVRHKVDPTIQHFRLMAFRFFSHLSVTENIWLTHVQVCTSTRGPTCDDVTQFVGTMIPADKVCEPDNHQPQDGGEDAEPLAGR